MKTSFGPVKFDCQGDVLVPGIIWNRLATVLNDLSNLRGQIKTICL